jgi:hypothetical protein
MRKDEAVGFSMTFYLQRQMFYFNYGKNKQNAFFVGILEAAAKKSRILIRNPV